MHTHCALIFRINQLRISSVCRISVSVVSSGGRLLSASRSEFDGLTFSGWRSDSVSSATCSVVFGSFESCRPIRVAPAAGVPLAPSSSQHTACTATKTHKQTKHIYCYSTRTNTTGPPQQQNTNPKPSTHPFHQLAERPHLRHLALDAAHPRHAQQQHALLRVIVQRLDLLIEVGRLHIETSRMRDHTVHVQHVLVLPPIVAQPVARRVRTVRVHEFPVQQQAGAARHATVHAIANVPGDGDVCIRADSHRFRPVGRIVELKAEAGRYDLRPDASHRGARIGNEKTGAASCARPDLHHRRNGGQWQRRRR